MAYSSVGDAVGAVLNRQWRLVRLIGEGGLAAVYEADGLNGEGKRAIKMLHPQFQSQPLVIERFYVEAKACFSLRHPHIAAVEAYAYAEDGSPYIVMELLSGCSLAEFLAVNRKMPLEQAAPVLYGVLQALSLAHSRGIVHRDLKPENLFLVPNERGDFAVKVLDFGVAKVMDVLGGMGSKTRTGALLGTPGYMSPEQITNAKGVDARSDLWAAGVVFYEMLSGHHPFGDEQLNRMLAVLRDPHQALSQFEPSLAKWDAFFDKSLARDFEQRFGSAEQMAEALRSRAQGTPVRFVPDGLQTVAIPLMSDRRQDATPAGATPAGVTPAAGGPGPSMVAPATSPSAVAVGLDTPAPLSPNPVSPAGPMGPVAGAPVGGTQLSGGVSPGVGAGQAPFVHVTTAPDMEPASMVWWAALLIAIVAFVVGMASGYLVATW